MRIDMTRALYRSGEDVVLCLDAQTLARLGILPGTTIHVASPALAGGAQTLKRKGPSSGAMEGKKVPSFAMEDQDGNVVSDKDLKGTPFVLYFYPKDDTPGCTKEACGIRDAWSRFEAAGLKVYGVSKDDANSHVKFRTKYDLPFDLLVADESTLESFGVWKEKSMYGRKFMGISRETLLVGGDGKVLKHYPKVSPEGHAEEILADWKELS